MILSRGREAQYVMRPWSGMKFPVDFAQAAAGDVGIDFGGADAGVTEQFLDDAQVGAMFQEVRGEAVAKHVWGGSSVAGLEAGAAGALLDAQPEGDGRKGGAAFGEKRRWRASAG